MSDQDQIIEEQKRAVKKNKHENKVDNFQYDYSDDEKRKVVFIV